MSPMFLSHHLSQVILKRSEKGKNISMSYKSIIYPRIKIARFKTEENVYMVLSSNKSETINDLPKMVLIDGLFGLFFFFFSSAIEGEGKKFPNQSIKLVHELTTRKRITAGYVNTNCSMFILIFSSLSLLTVF